MIEKLLREALQNKVSDIHITSNEKIAFRSKKKIETLDYKVSEEDVMELAKKLAGSKHEQFLEDKQIDVGGEISGVRYRANIFYERGGIAIAIRIIDNEIKSVYDLSLPPLLFELIKKPHGLIIVTGPTGSGKSTTLAAMINEINKDFSKHIVTIEEPIEYNFTNQKSIIHQREIGTDVNSFSDGLRSVLRQDPDVIMIGELRDKRTIETALKASETGHLVLTTLHTSDAKSTINRMTGVFQAEDAVRIRSLLGDSLIAIISQKLIRRADNSGVIPAFEILMNTTATSNLIKKGEVAQIDSYLLMDQRIGSIPMSKSIETLVKKRIINESDVN